MVVALLAAPGGAAARPGDEVRSRSLHLTTSSFATRGYTVTVETVGHHRVILTAAKNSQVATYTVRGKVSRHRIKADFGRFGRVNLHFYGRPRPFKVKPATGQTARAKRRRCRGRKPEREVGRFRGAVEFDGQQLFTRLAVGGLKGELRRSYRQVCWLRRASPEARAHLSSGQEVVRRAGIPSTAPSVAVLSVRARGAGALTRFNVIHLEPPPGIPFARDFSLSLVASSQQERVGRIRVFRSTFLIAEGSEVRISRRGVRPVKARVALGTPFEGSARFRTASGEMPSSWEGDLVVRLPGTGPLPLTGPRFHATFCRVSAFRPHSPCFRRAEARVLAAQGSGSHSHPLALARLSSLR